jgi:2,4-diketo-3-deoxy-L-fuconate hydrolase
MKLLRHGPKGAERPGLLDADGVVRDLSGVVPDIGPAQLGPAEIARLAAIDPASLPRVEGTPRLGVPVAGIGKLIGIGLNYADHAAEAGMQVPPEPIVFMKATSCLSGPHDPVLLPPGSERLDWEVELGFVIGRTATRVDEASAMDHVCGYVVVNDVSEREWQTQRAGQWTKGKSHDTFGPVGPWLVTKDEVADPQALDLWLEVNGARMQQGSTRTMVYGVRHLVSYLSRFMTLHPGDVVATGTPPGVGMGMKPPRFLKAGDVMRLGIQGLGEQRQEVVAAV